MFKQLMNFPRSALQILNLGMFNFDEIMIHAREARWKMSHVNNTCVKCCMWCLKWFEIDVNWSNTLCDLIQHGHFLSKIYAFWSILRGIIWHYFPHCKLIWSWQTLCYNFHRYNFYRYGYWVWIYYNLDYFYVYIRGCFGSCIATIQHISVDLVLVNNAK